MFTINTTDDAGIFCIPVPGNAAGEPALFVTRARAIEYGEWLQAQSCLPANWVVINEDEED